uniref:Secreted protein n=1 Tax=Heterorhabditis bacteriophora TaxID=37862 RepID=A0A1I7WBL4_HETBA
MNVNDAVIQNCHYFILTGLIHLIILPTVGHFGPQGNDLHHFIALAVHTEVVSVVDDVDVIEQWVASSQVALKGRRIKRLVFQFKGLHILQFMLSGVIHTKKKWPHARYDGPSVPVLLATRECAQQVQ